MKYMCREFPDEFVVEANSVEEAEEILDCMGCYMQDEEDGTIPCDGPVPVERGMSKKCVRCATKTRLKCQIGKRLDPSSPPLLT